jgi:hypothetical protein
MQLIYEQIYLMINYKYAIIMYTSYIYNICVYDYSIRQFTMLVMCTWSVTLDKNINYEYTSLFHIPNIYDCHKC